MVVPEIQSEVIKQIQDNRARKRLNVLFEVSEKVISSLNLKEVLGRIMKLAIDTLSADSGSIMLLNEKTGRLHIKESVGIKKEIVRNTSVKIGERIAGWVAKHQKPLILLNGLKQYPNFSHISGKGNIGSAISIPLRNKRQLIGVLNINRLSESDRPTFQEEDLELLTTLANQTVVAINNARLHQEVKEQNLKLSRADRLKTELISHITHELRTPLSAIRGHTSNILDGILGGLTPAQRERLEKIEKLCSRQSNLVNQLLDISHIASGKVELTREPIMLKLIVDNALNSIMPLVEEKKLIIENQLTDNLPEIWGIPEQLERVFINLFSNAIKYTPEGGSVKIKSSPKQGFIEVTLADTGIGIPKASVPRIFDEFYQVDNEINKKTPGTGLGLTLVKHIIELHKGKLWLKSTPGKGTTFGFTLPVDPRMAKRRRDDK